MTEQEILDELSEIVSDVLNLPDVKLTRETTAPEVPGWDSLTHIQIVVTAESRFGVKFRPAELDSAHDVGELVDMLQKKMKR